MRWSVSGKERVGVCGNVGEIFHVITQSGAHGNDKKTAFGGESV